MVCQNVYYSPQEVTICNDNHGRELVYIEYRNESTIYYEKRWIYVKVFWEYCTSGCEGNGPHPPRQRLDIVFRIRMTDVINK